MNKYSATKSNLARKILHHGEKICKGEKRPVFKLICDVMFGLMAGQSCKLSEIARSLHEKTSLKKTIERLSLGLKNFGNIEVLQANHVRAVKKHIKSDTPLIIDGGDVTKPYGEKFEDLCHVRDGSTGEIEKGYWSMGCVALTEQKLPIAVYDKLYSTKSHDFMSENAEIFKALDFLDEHFEKTNIRAFDRGFDRGKIFEKLIKTSVDFIVRLEETRNLIYKGKSINVLKLTNRFKGKCVLECGSKKDKTYCKVSIIPVKLPKFPNVELSLVMCYGFGKKPMMLLTSLPKNSDKIGVTLVKVYLMRWRIEEFYRLKKVQFGFEDFRVRNLVAIQNLSIILNFSLSLLAILGDKAKESIMVADLIEWSRRIYRELAGFCLYAIADGIKRATAHCETGIWRATRKRHYDSQICLFNWNLFGIDCKIA